MWNKKGLIFCTDHHQEWMVSHACVPTTILLPNKRIRIYFAARNAIGQSIPTFIEVDGENPSEVIYVHDTPVMPLGKIGTFDDGGIMPCCIVNNSGVLYLYYVGWNPSVSVPYRNSIGLAISKDGGVHFERLFEGPIVDRTMNEPYFTASPFVMKESETKWHIWYASSIGFVPVDDKNEPLYVIKYGTSNDGIHWSRTNHTCIEQKHSLEANARPCVIVEDGKYKMWFCYRGSLDYRDGKDSYRIGYAESFNAKDWLRMDEKAGIELSTEGWDSTMLTYPCIQIFENKKYLFYNGNGFGKTGIGYAIADK